MDDSKFQALLDAYINREATEAQLEQLRSVIDDSQYYRELFQRETRLNALLHETAAEQAELHLVLGFDDSSNRPFRAGSAFRSVRRWQMPLAVAVLFVLIAFAFRTLWTSDDRQVFGVCMSLSGSVLIERDSAQRLATRDDTLFVSDRIVCDGGSTAMIRMRDGSILAMEPGSEMTLTSSSPTIRLERGEVLFEVAEREQDEQPFLVETPQSQVSVLGTVFSLSCSDHTELKVYEGEVALTRRRDNASVSVNSQQQTSTQSRRLNVESMGQESASPTQVLTLLPTDDVTSINGRIEDNSYLKVEGKRRVVYLRFEIPQLDRVIAGRLRLKQSVDTGSGILKIHAGEHSRWSESTSDTSQLPRRMDELDSRSGIVGRNSVVEFDLPSNAIQETVTLVLSLDLSDEHDVWFASRESTSPPQLILTAVQ